MKRKALLIDAGKATGQKFIAGPPHDVKRLRTWMVSNNGGAWENSEIETLSNPSWAHVRAAVANLSGAEYAFVAFSGHGWIEEDGRTGRSTQKVIIGTGESIDLGVLRPEVSKCTLLCDACREVEQVFKLSQGVANAAKYARDKEKYTRESYRQWYDNAIKVAGDGAFFLYGCSPNEYCYEDPMSGGYFTGALIEHAASWCDNVRAHGCLSVSQALQAATPTVARKSRQFKPPQNPMGGAENRAKGNEFPFAVAFV